MTTTMNSAQVKVAILMACAERKSLADRKRRQQEEAASRQLPQQDQPQARPQQEQPVALTLANLLGPGLERVLWVVAKNQGGHQVGGSGLLR